MAQEHDAAASKPRDSLTTGRSRVPTGPTSTHHLSAQLDVLAKIFEEVEEH